MKWPQKITFVTKTQQGMVGGEQRASPGSFPVASQGKQSWGSGLGLGKSDPWTGKNLIFSTRKLGFGLPALRLFVRLGPPLDLQQGQDQTQTRVSRQKENFLIFCPTKWGRIPILGALCAAPASVPMGCFGAGPGVCLWSFLLLWE